LAQNQLHPQGKQQKTETMRRRRLPSLPLEALKFNSYFIFSFLFNFSLIMPFHLFFSSRLREALEASPPLQQPLAASAMAVPEV
jgi:hypothetical protein